MQSSPRGVNTETIGKLKQEESGFEAHIFTDSIFIGFHGIVYCTQSALRYIPKTPFFWRFSANVSLPDHDFGSKFRNPSSWCRGETPRWGWIGLWIL